MGVFQTAMSHWQQPEGGRQTGLRIFNSLTGNTDAFIPSNGNQVSRYICGPTVYDSSHVGHARNYMTFDILRRIMSDYFRYDVFYVMNITDLDDKIIIRSHQRHLQSVIEFIATLDHPSVDTDQVKTLISQGELLVSLKNAAIADISACTGSLKETLAALTKEGVTVPAEFQTEYCVQEGYLNLARHFEQEFFEDLDMLNIRRPNAVTRVSEYVPNIVDYVQKIIDNGYAYESHGDVYFDLQSFEKDGFTYHKCSPSLSSEASAELLDEGEGALVRGGYKRHPFDFALWKQSKPGEPGWDSPWGKGRPGWHIECSAMAGDLLGSNVDINCGGVDLRFPHHDNQLAQSEAHYGCKQWVNYFLHTGHLHIQGHKMAKSLKNFITIRECLRIYSANQLRIMFLKHRFDSPLDIDLVGAGNENNGTLMIESATIGSTSVLDQARALIENDRVFELQKGTNVCQKFEIPSSSDSFAMTFSLDGEPSITLEWELEEGVLGEPIALRAGGRIRQMEEAVQLERKFTDFILNCRTLLRLQAPRSQTYLNQRWTEEDKNLQKDLNTVRQAFHEALCDSINTPKCLELLQQLINTTNGYMKANYLDVKRDLLVSILTWFTNSINVFGINTEEDLGQMGYQWEESHPRVVENRVSSVLDEFCSRRDSIRAAARDKVEGGLIQTLCEHNYIAQTVNEDSPISQKVLAAYIEFLASISAVADQPQAVLKLCDRVRDDVMPFLGVRFEDDAYMKGVSVWKLDSIASILRDRERDALICARANERSLKRNAKSKKLRARRLNWLPSLPLSSSRSIPLGPENSVRMTMMACRSPRLMARNCPRVW